MSTNCLIIVREVVEEFTKILKEEIKSNQAKGARYAVLRGIANHTYSLLEEVEKNGAIYLVGANNFIGDTRALLQPTIITNVKARDKVYTKETFRPLATLYIIESEGEAIKLVNNTLYSLNIAVYSIDIFAALRVAK